LKYFFFFRDNRESLFIFLDAALQDFEKSLGISGRGNDSGMELRIPITTLELAKVEQELEGILADLEIISVVTFRHL
jgi:hypothetical protein